MVVAAFGGSTAFFTIALLIICLLVLLLLRHYLPIRSTPAYLLVPVFLALALPCSIILLVPIDLASNAVEEDGQGRGIRLPDGAMLVVWRITYWLTFVLTWLVLPLLGEYSDSGYRDPRSRLRYSIRSNVRYQLTVLSCAIAGLVYYIFSAGFSGSSIKALVVALAYAWGLILAIYLMGHGLVALPRRIFKTAGVVNRLRLLQASAPHVHDRMTQAITDLEDLENQVWELKRTKARGEFREWIEELVETSDMLESRANVAATASRATSSVPAIVTERYMADLTRKLKRARHKRIRFIEEWDSLLTAATDAQAILDAAGSRQLDFGRPSPADSFFARLRVLNPTLRYYLHTYILPATSYALSGVLVLLSASIIWSEFFSPVFPILSIVRYTVIHHPNSETTGKIGFAGQVIAGVWLCYMCTCALYSIRHVPIWGNRALVRRHTYAESAAWYASQVAKLTVPLSFNFITLLPREIFRETAFYRFLGHLIDMTGLSSGFNHYFQMIILLPVAAAMFNLYGKVKGVLGFGVLEDESNENESGFGGWREGRALIERERYEHGTSSGSGRAGTGGLGLNDRDASPSSPYADAPSSTARTAHPSTLRQTAATSSSSRLPPPASANVEDGENEGNFFSDFAHRVRNTFDTATDRPDFSFPNLNISRPKWMGGPGTGMAGEETSGRADFGGTLGRWFGGRPDDGRVRL